VAQTVRIIGVRIDLGAGRRGVDMGPSALRKAGIRTALRDLGYDVIDDGNIHCEEPEAHTIKDPKLKYLPLITVAMTELAERVENALESDEVPLVLGGDHSIAIGTIGGAASYFKKTKKKLGMIWIDAHGDSNTAETTPSGNIHGMSHAIAFGRGAKELVAIGGFADGESKLDAKRSSIIGARDLDRLEKDVLREIGVKVFSMDQVDRRGIYDVTKEAIDIAGNGTEGIHVSFDVDGMDPSVAPGVGTAVNGGLSYRETHTIMELIAETDRLASLEVAEVNPILDVRNTTAEVAVAMVASAFGKRIL